MTGNRLFILITMLVALISCDKVYINGDLDGMWQLQRVEIGDTVEYPQGIYYSFQRHLVQVGKYYEEGMPLRYTGNLDYKGNTLTISNLRKFLEEEKPATEHELAIFHLYDTETVFNIEKLNDEMLILCNDKKRYVLKKW